MSRNPTTVFERCAFTWNQNVKIILNNFYNSHKILHDIHTQDKITIRRRRGWWLLIEEIIPRKYFIIFFEFRKFITWYSRCSSNSASFELTGFHSNDLARHWKWLNILQYKEYMEDFSVGGLHKFCTQRQMFGTFRCNPFW